MEPRVLLLALALSTAGCAGPSARDAHVDPSAPPNVPEHWSAPETIRVLHRGVFKTFDVHFSLAADGLSACATWTDSDGGNEPDAGVEQWIWDVGWRSFPLGTSRTLPDCGAAPAARDFVVWSANVQRDFPEGVAYVRELSSPDIQAVAATPSLEPWDGSLRLVVLPTHEPAIAWARAREVGFAWRGPAGWTAEPVAAAEPDSTLHSVELAVDPAGNVFVIWRKDLPKDPLSPITGEIVVRRRDATGLWDREETVGLTIQCCASPRIGVDGAGRATALWRAADGAETTIWAAHYAPGGGWTPAQKIATNPDPYGRDPMLAVSATGDVVAAWSQLRTEPLEIPRSRIRAARYHPDLGWTPAEWIGFPLGREFLVDVAANRRGRFEVLWLDDDGNHFWTRPFAQGQWGTTEHLPNVTAHGVVTGQIGIADDGRIFAVWVESRTGDNHHIRASRRSSR